MSKVRYEKLTRAASNKSKQYYQGWQDAAAFKTGDEGLKYSPFGIYLYYPGGFIAGRAARYGS